MCSCQCLLAHSPELIYTNKSLPFYEAHQALLPLVYISQYYLLMEDLPRALSVLFSVSQICFLSVPKTCLLHFVRLLAQATILCNGSTLFYSFSLPFTPSSTLISIALSFSNSIPFILTIFYFIPLLPTSFYFFPFLQEKKIITFHSISFFSILFLFFPSHIPNLSRKRTGN